MRHRRHDLLLIAHPTAQVGRLLLNHHRDSISRGDRRSRLLLSYRRSRRLNPSAARQRRRRKLSRNPRQIGPPLSASGPPWSSG
jgi:hypothetical protein